MPAKPNLKVRQGAWKRKSPKKAVPDMPMEPEPLITEDLGDLEESWMTQEPREDVTHMGPLPSPLALEPPKTHVPNAKDPGKALKVHAGIRVIERMLDDPIYLQTIQDRMRAGKLAPQLEALFWQRVHGRPSEAPKEDGNTGPVPVKIIHEFTTIVTHEDK